MSDLNRMIRSRKGVGKIVTPFYEDYLREHNNMQFSEELIDEVIKGDLATPQRDRTKSLSASSLGFCQRAHLYQYFDQPQKKRRTANMPIFHNGTFVHLRWQMILRHQGILREVEVPLSKTHSGILLRGTSDGIGVLPFDDATEDDQFIFELKSINSYGFKSVMEYGPKKEHLYQFHAYMWMADIDRYSIVYEDKNTQDYIEYTGRLDEAILKDVLKEVSELSDAVSTPEDAFPDMLDDCKFKSGYTYKGCPFRDVCHRHEAGEISLRPRRLRIRRSA